VREWRRHLENHVGWTPDAILDDRLPAVDDEGDVRLQDDVLALIENDLDAHPQPSERLRSDVHIERRM
jgi:hypothetical protein